MYILTILNEEGNFDAIIYSICTYIQLGTSIKIKCCKRPRDALRQIKIPNVIFTDETTVPILYTSYEKTQLLKVVTNTLPVKLCQGILKRGKDCINILEYGLACSMVCIMLVTSCSPTKVVCVKKTSYTYFRHDDMTV